MARHIIKIEDASIKELQEWSKQVKLSITDGSLYKRDNWNKFVGGEQVYVYLTSGNYAEGTLLSIDRNAIELEIRTLVFVCTGECVIDAGTWNFNKTAIVRIASLGGDSE